MAERSCQEKALSRRCCLKEITTPSAAITSGTMIMAPRLSARPSASTAAPRRERLRNTKSMPCLSVNATAEKPWISALLVEMHGVSLTIATAGAIQERISAWKLSVQARRPELRQEQAQPLFERRMAK